TAPGIRQSAHSCRCATRPRTHGAEAVPDRLPPRPVAGGSRWAPTGSRRGPSPRRWAPTCRPGALPPPGPATARPPTSASPRVVSSSPSWLLLTYAHEFVVDLGSERLLFHGNAQRAYLPLRDSWVGVDGHVNRT